MFCSRNSYNLIISQIEKRSLKLIANDENNTFEYILRANIEITTRRNLQVLMAEVTKITTGIAQPIMDVFPPFRNI